MTLSPGTRLGPYAVIAKIGEGGMGEVYSAEDTRLGRRVALKLLTKETADSPERLDRFEPEAKAVAALNHPNIVTIHSIEEADGHRFLTMELVEGQTLADLIVESGLPLKEFFELAIPIAEALTAAHERRVLHRDLKPTNVMVGENRRVKILDFGLAKLMQSDTDATVAEVPIRALTQEGRILGTIPYMSPEQVEGRTLDHRSDIFSLGVLLYEMATGRRPFVGETSPALMSSILKDTPVPATELRPELPRQLDRILRRCLAKSPKRRYQTALDASNELEDLRRELASGESAGPTKAIPRIVAAAKQKKYRTPLVGRKREVDELGTILERAANGTGSLVMISGELGVGKSRLADELVFTARERGFLTMVGQCYEEEGAPPFAPWAEHLEYTARIAPRETLRNLLGDSAPEVAKLMPELRRMFPDIPPPLNLPPEQERHYLFNRFREYVERSSQLQPLLITLEDLQWADESTLLLLHHMAQHAGEMAVLLVGTYRDVELDVGRPLAKTIRELVRLRLAHRMALKRLSESDVAVMLEALAGQRPPRALARGLFRETEGNPFFIEEVFQHLEEEGKLRDAAGKWRRDLNMQELDVPEGVRLVIGRRLERVDKQAREVLTTAALIGRGFSFDLLEALGQTDPETLLNAMEEAERLNLITPVASASREDRFTFAHQLLRQTLVSGLSHLRRRRLHLRIAEAIETVYAGDLERQASALAHHLYQAGAAADSEKTLHYLVLAGKQAMKAAAPEDALRHFDEALALVSEDDRARRAELLFRRGWTRRSVGRWDDGLEDWLEALPLYEALGDTRAAVRICRGVCAHYLWTRQIEEAAELSERGLDIVGTDASAGRSRFLAIAGLNQGGAGNYAPGDTMLTEAVAMAEELGSEPVLGEALANRTAFYYYYDEYRESLADGERATELLRSVGALWQMSSGMQFSQWAHLFLGHPAESATIREELEPLASRIGHRGVLRLVAQCRGFSALMRSGDLDAYEAVGNDELEMRVHLGRTAEEGGFGALGLVDFWRGNWTRARERLQRATDPSDVSPVAGIPWSILFRLEAYEKTGSALELFESRRNQLPGLGAHNTRCSWSILFAAVEVLAFLERREEAAALYPLVVDALGTGVVISQNAYGLIETVAGIAAAAGRQWEAAEAHYERAVRQAHELPHRLHQPEVRRWYATMLIERNTAGDHDRARQFLDQAVEDYGQLGMSRHLDIAKSLVDQL